VNVELELERPERRGRPAVVASPHPLYGGRSDNPVVLALARALGECGYAPLRFNWRGVGSSSGKPSGRLEDAIEDYRSALAASRRGQGDGGGEQSTGARVLAAGYSFGAVAALALALEDELAVERLVLVAPPVSMLRALDLAALERDVHVIVGGCDSLARTDELAEVVANAAHARFDVIPDADHFFGAPFWLERLAEIVSTALA
jgi:hypothetical protein